MVPRSVHPVPWHSDTLVWQGAPGVPDGLGWRPRTAA